VLEPRRSPLGISPHERLTNFGIFATSGEEYKTVVEQFAEVAPGNGTFTI
jgi:hypothetical protein